MTIETTSHVAIDDVDFSGIQRIHVRDLTHPQNGWEMVANNVSVWVEIENGTLNVFVTDAPQGRVYDPDAGEVTYSE